MMRLHTTGSLLLTLVYIVAIFLIFGVSRLIHFLGTSWNKDSWKLPRKKKFKVTGEESDEVFVIKLTDNRGCILQKPFEHELLLSKSMLKGEIPKLGDMVMAKLNYNGHIISARKIRRA